ncbi:MAG: lytic transglycosylase domain-containing protein [Candidatus Firestonebacteria bacterium]
MKKKNNKKIVLLSVLLVILTIILLLVSDWFWTALSPITHNVLLDKYSKEYKLDPLLVAAIIKSESTFNPIAVSEKGAVGLMQLMPSTAEEMAHELNVDYVDVEDLYDPEINIHLGYYYMVKLLKRYNGNLVFALAAYNAGTKNADEWIKNYRGNPDRAAAAIIFPETRKFIKEVQFTYEILKFVRKLRRILQLKDI